MYLEKIILFTVILTVTNAAKYRKVYSVQKKVEPQPTTPGIVTIPEESKLEDSNSELEQNKNARYEFSSNVEDKIQDLHSSRHEIRDGLNVVGQYSYSDGYYKRTVYYQADENGYRVTKQEAELLPEDGPHIDRLGEALISTSAHGSSLFYRVKSVLKDDDYVIEEIAE